MEVLRVVLSQIYVMLLLAVKASTAVAVKAFTVVDQLLAAGGCESVTSCGLVSLLPLTVKASAAVTVKVLAVAVQLPCCRWL